MKTNNIHCISILRQYSNLVKSLKKETMAENLLSLLLEKNINITSFLDITEGIPKAMLTNLCNQLNINKIAKLFQFTSKEDKIYCEYGNNTNDNIPNVHIDFLIEKNKYYLRVFDNNGILNLKADEFGENLNLTLDDELKLHKEYPYEGKTTINIIFSDLKEIDKVKVLVDNEIAIENLTKFAGVRHYQIVTGDDGDDFYAIIAKEGIDEELDFNEKSGDVVVISSKTMGSNEELGAVLMKSFIFALTKQDQLPKEMIFYNEGIFLTTNEGDILNDLKYLESQGVDIVSCGTCLDFFNRKELLQVGTVTNMYDIVERMEKAEKVIKP